MRTTGKWIAALGALALMASPAWAQGRGGFGGGMMVGQLLTNKSVLKELKVTDEQASKLETLATELREKNQPKMAEIRELPEDERPAKMRALQVAMQEDLHKGIADVLKPDQVKRFDQVQIQAGGLNAFAMPKVQEALKITDDQKPKIQEISQETMQAAREAMQDAGDDRAAAMKKATEIRKGGFDKVVALLSDDQKKAWADLIGEPFAYVPEMPRRPGN